MPSKKITIASPEGSIQAHVAHPEGRGPSPGVLMFMDGPGWRPALFAMADRLATQGYYVLLPNMHWRAGDFVPFDVKTLFSNPVELDRMRKVFASTTEEGAMRDTQVFLDFLSAQPEVQGEKPFGTHGYCMGGGFAMLAACVFADRFAAAASFHGGRLVVAPEGPERLAREAKARLYFGVSELDKSHTPEVTKNLTTALERAGKDFQLEVYAGASHGFAVPDLPVYNEAAAEKHWERLLALYGETLP